MMTRSKPSSLDGTPVAGQASATPGKHTLTEGLSGPTGAPGNDSWDDTTAVSGPGTRSAAASQGSPASSSVFLQPGGLARAGSRRGASPATGSLNADLGARLQADGVDALYADLADLGGAHAGDPALRAALISWRGRRLLSWAQAFRCVAFQVYGAQATWPLVVRNFADGIDAGIYRVTDLPPDGTSALREYCVKAAGRAADGIQELDCRYRADFNARFDSTRFVLLTSEFDPSLDSKGPRTPRARAVFRELYANAIYGAAYDLDTPPGFRLLCDTFMGPDGTNLIASPRLHALRVVLDGPLVHADSTTDARYVALVNEVSRKASGLDARDRQEIDDTHAWRLAVEGKVIGSSPSITRVLRADLWEVVTGARAPAPASTPAPIATPAATSNTSAPEIPALPAPTERFAPTAEERAFLSSITLAAPASPVEATASEQALAFEVRGAPNPGLGITRRVVVEPAAQILEGQLDEAPWATDARAADHVARVDPQPVSGPSTTVTAHLTLPTVDDATFPMRSASVEVVDKRLDFVIANLRPGLTFVDHTDKTTIAAGATAHYTGKQCPIAVTPNLGPGHANPGLSLQLDGVLQSAGKVHALPRASFGAHASALALFQTILCEPAEVDQAPEDWTLSLRVFHGTERAAFHTPVHPFRIARTPNASLDADEAQMQADNAWLNGSIDVDGTLLHYMAHKGGHHARVARGVATGGLKVRACFVRSDSADQVTALAGATATSSRVAYAMGAIDPRGRAANTLVGVPGACGWRWSVHPDTVYLNATSIPGHGHRPLDTLAEFLAHEACHAADLIEGNVWGRYATEFRAYWLGEDEHLSTAFDASMSGAGPKSQRARRIFERMYRSPTYAFVKAAYDANDSGFRERVDNYLFPDGINLTLSGELAALRTAIEATMPGEFAATRAALAAKFAACSSADAHEVAANRAWRDLVDARFPTVRDRNQITDLLRIPR